PPAPPSFAPLLGGCATTAPTPTPSTPPPSQTPVPTPPPPVPTPTPTPTPAGEPRITGGPAGEVDTIALDPVGRALVDANGRHELEAAARLEVRMEGGRAV